MLFEGRNEEYLLLETVNGSTVSNYNNRKNSVLSIVWVTKGTLTATIDGVKMEVPEQHILFFTQYHHVTIEQYSEYRFIQFNRAFFCIIDHDQQVGCKGILFFGASRQPVMRIPVEEEQKFALLWQAFVLEAGTTDELQMEMLQTMLKRFLILCTRLYKEQNTYDKADANETDLVREFNFLVEQHYRTLHKVADYADLLARSPKTLANVFASFGKTPLQVIQERIILEARRLMQYSEKSIKEIAYETGFEDIQSFSRFFKANTGISPTAYKQQSGGGNIAN